MTRQIDVNDVIKKLQNRIGEQTTTIVLLELQLEMLREDAAKAEESVEPLVAASANGARRQARSSEGV